MAWFAQPFFKEVGIPLAYFGVLWAGLNFSAGITSYNSYKYDNYSWSLHAQTWNNSFIDKLSWKDYFKYVRWYQKYNSASS